LNLPVEIYSVENVRRIDDAAIHRAGISGYALMTRAAQAALDAARQKFPEAKRWQVVCGPGNNGGDGYVLARLASQQGLTVSVLAMTPAAKLSGDALTACTDFVAQGGNVGAWTGLLDSDADLLVDAVFASGLQRDVEGGFAAVIDAINAHAANVIALDIPSGLNGESGAIMGTAVRADLTVTFVGLKSGLVLGSSGSCVGELAFSSLDIPEDCRRGIPVAMRRSDTSLLVRALPARKRDAHKGDFGHLLLIGGGPGMPGAIRLAGIAALRSGAGRVSIATHPSSVPAVAASLAELMVHAAEQASDLKPVLDRATTIAIGPGLGTDAWARALLDSVLASGLPLVVDADALNLLADRPQRSDRWILTPHPGEAARLLGRSAGEVQRDRTTALAELQRRYGGTVVLKGARTLVSAGEEPCWVCTSGNPGMATAGTGDVLAGCIASLLAQGLSPELAAVCGVQAHALAGDDAAGAGQRGMIASDLMPGLRAHLNP
jgi:NAD(P)H-hydrate epimerase